MPKTRKELEVLLKCLEDCLNESKDWTPAHSYEDPKRVADVKNLEELVAEVKRLLAAMGDEVK